MAIDGDTCLDMKCIMQGKSGSSPVDRYHSGGYNYTGTTTLVLEILLENKLLFITLGIVT